MNTRAGKNDWAVALLNQRFFWKHVNMTDTCWLWTANSRSGYPRVMAWANNKAIGILAHRASYIFRHGAIPAGLEIDHTCRHPLCVNPDHLEAKTPSQNQANGGPKNPATRNINAIVCSEGHPYDATNTYRDPRGRRHCRKCMSEAGKKYRRNQKAFALAQDWKA